MDRKKANRSFRRYLLLIGTIIVIFISFRIPYVTSKGDWFMTIFIGACILYLILFSIEMGILLTRKWGRRLIKDDIKRWCKKQEIKRLEKRERFWYNWYHGPSFMDHFRDDDPWRY